MSFRQRLVASFCIALNAGMSLLAQGATLKVDTTNDAVSANACDLRTAISAVNKGQNQGGCLNSNNQQPYGNNDTITMVAGTYLMNFGQLKLEKSVHIHGEGLGTTLDMLSKSRAFHIPGPAKTTVIIDNVNILNGWTDGDGGAIDDWGGGGELVFSNGVIKNCVAEYSGGAILSSGTLKIINSTLEKNVSSFGGAIHSNSSVEIHNSVISNNVAADAGGGISVQLGSLMIQGSLIEQNKVIGGYGGGIYIEDAFGQISTTSVESNEALPSDITNGAGGGLVILNSNVDITSSSITGNYDFPGTTKHPAVSAGGVFNGDTSGGFTVTTVTNSTISHNHTLDKPGAQIYNYGEIRLYGSTIFEEGDDSDDQAVYGIDNPDGTLFSKNSIIAARCTSPMSSEGYNVEISKSCGLDLQGINMNDLILPLSPTGGFNPTWIHPLPKKSPAIDLSQDCSGFEGTTITYDQRGTLRPQDGNGDGKAFCDSGAYELSVGG